MPRKGGYRGRAVRKVRQQGNRKAHNPTVKFVLNKSYVVTPTAGQTISTNMLTINASTPFSPIHQINGDWDANDVVNEPMGLGSDLYTHYQHLVVKGCHVTASVTDEPDKVAGATETLTKGTIAIARHTGIGSLPYSTFDANQLKTIYGCKQKNFQLSPRGSGAGTANVSNNILTKNAKVSNGYSAKKTWNTNANANDDLRVINTSGSANIPNDSTFLSIGVMPQRVSATGITALLQPVLVNVRIVYIIQFQEPSFKQSVPLPMSVSSNNGGGGTNYTHYYEKGKEFVNNKFVQQGFQMGLNYVMGYGTGANRNQFLPIQNPGNPRVLMP